MWAKPLFVALLAATAFGLGACAAPQTSELTLSPGALPMQAEASNVPFFPQEDNFCGPAALATVVAWTGISVDPEQIAERVYTPGRKGTLQSDILAAARREGRFGQFIVVHQVQHQANGGLVLADAYRLVGLGDDDKVLCRFHESLEVLFLFVRGFPEGSGVELAFLLAVDM